ELPALCVDARDLRSLEGSIEDPHDVARGLLPHIPAGTQEDVRSAQRRLAENGLVELREVPQPDKEPFTQRNGAGLARLRVLRAQRQHIALEVDVAPG